MQDTDYSELLGFAFRHPYDHPIDFDNYVVDYDYFEAILDVDGKLYEAPNGHTIGLVKIAATRLGKTYDEIQAMCPKEYYGDYMTWLCKISGAIPLWRNFYRGDPNDKQLETLKIIKDKGWYVGEIHITSY